MTDPVPTAVLRAAVRRAIHTANFEFDRLALQDVLRGLDRLDATLTQLDTLRDAILMAEWEGRSIPNDGSVECPWCRATKAEDEPHARDCVVLVARGLDPDGV